LEIAPVPRPAAIRWTLRSLCSLVFCVCGVQVCRETLRKVLHSLGLSFKKAHKLLGKASPQKRAEFVQTLGALLQQAQQDDGPLLVFADEAHIHIDVEPGHGWSPRGQRLYVNSNSPGLGKKRTCFGLYLYGATEPVQIHVTDWATSDSTCEVLSALRQAYPHKTLVLIWDNVRYHHSKQVRNKAEELGIQLLYLPPYSPDLMPVERLWSWLRQTLGYLHCHADEAELQERIAAFVCDLLEAPTLVHRRLVPNLYLDPAVEKLRGSV
jgi:transposase